VAHVVKSKILLLYRTGRSFVEEACIGQIQKLRKGEVCWLTGMTPHEARPLEIEVTRQFLRLVTSGLAVWHEDHSDASPLGIVPA
jgi:hypothetical protein